MSPAARVKEKTTTATDVVRFCENELSIDFHDDPTTPAWKRVSVEAGKLNAQIKRKSHVTLDDLLMTAKWCVRHRVLVSSPSGLIYHVEKAKADLAPDVSETDVDTDLREAVFLELAARNRGDELAVYWINRLQRAVGQYREPVLTEWREARAHG